MTNWFRHSSSPNFSDLERQSSSDTKTLQKWNKIFLIACAIAIFVDPLFLYIPIFNRVHVCLELDKNLEIIGCVLRTVIDAFYILRIIFQITEFITPNSYGGGEVVQNHRVKDKRSYLAPCFIVDVLSILPLPQMVILVFIKPNIGGLALLVKRSIMEIVIFVQYVPRLIRIYPIYKELKSSFGMITETAWAGAVSNLLLYLLASHIIGAFWYMVSIERGFYCWRRACEGNNSCIYSNLYCGRHQNATYTYMLDQCAFIEPEDIRNATSEFNFGIFAEALASGAADSSNFLEKFIYCIWWGLRNVSSMGQNLKTSTFFWENVFTIFISIAGLILFALFIGNMQRYLQYLQPSTERLQEMRLQRKDDERWMSRRDLPDSIKERIKEYRKYKWDKTRGAVEDQALIRSLPEDLSRDINRKLGSSLITNVPRLKKMDAKILYALCDRLKPVVYSSNSDIIRDGDPVEEMIFIMSGGLESVEVDGASFNESFLNPGDFTGEALLTWALDPHSSSMLPISTVRVKTLTVVEAFTLVAEDLKSVASQFRLVDTTDSVV